MIGRLIKSTPEALESFTKVNKLAQENNIIFRASQIELLTAYCYWRAREIYNMPVRHLYLYPFSGATTLWRYVEEAHDEVIFMPATSKVIHDFKRKTNYRFTTLLEKKDSEKIRDKIIIVDGSFYLNPNIDFRNVLNTFQMRGLLLA